MRNYTKLLICGGVVDIDVHVDNEHDYVLVLIMVMLVNNHNDVRWIIMMIMLVNYIYLCAYMLIDGDVDFVDNNDDDLLCMDCNYLTMQWGVNHEDEVYII